MKLYGRTILLILSLLSVSPIRAGIVRVADNGLVVRSVDCSDGQLHSASYRLAGCEDGFTEGTSREFSFLADGKLYSGDSRWKEIEVSTDSCTVISLTSEDGRLKV